MVSKQGGARTALIMSHAHWSQFGTWISCSAMHPASCIFYYLSMCVCAHSSREMDRMECTSPKPSKSWIHAFPFAKAHMFAVTTHRCVCTAKHVVVQWQHKKSMPATTSRLRYMKQFILKPTMNTTISEEYNPVPEIPEPIHSLLEEVSLDIISMPQRAHGAGVSTLYPTSTQLITDHIF